MLYFAASIVTARRRRGAGQGPHRPRGQGPGRVGADLRRPRRAARRARGAARSGAATTSRRARTRASTRTTTSGPAASTTGPRISCCRRSRTCASSRPGIFPKLAHSLTTEDAKKIRELVRHDRDARRPQARPARARAGRDRRTADPRGARPAPRRARGQASGSKKGAITKHVHKLVDALLTGTELAGDDAELVAGVDAKNLEKAREVGNGLLADVLAQADAGDPSRTCASSRTTSACSGRAPRRTTSTPSASGR